MSMKRGITCRSMIGAGALSLTHFGSPCTWHPQGPIHPQPSPVPLHLAWPPPRSCVPRAVVRGQGGHLKCSGTGWLGGCGGPLWVPGLTTCHSMHRPEKLLGSGGGPCGCPGGKEAS